MKGRDVFHLQAYVDSRRSWVDKALKSCLPPKVPGGLAKAMRYSLLAGGKRLRPLLLLASAEACGAEPRSLLEAACALECVHTYSLIHDDLPALDDDDLRRGRPTCHKVFGEAMAILAGDGLLTLAFELVGGLRVAPARKAEASVLLARAAGCSGMVAGQVLDLQAEGRRLSAAGLKAVHAGKTGALLTAALECGAVLAGAAAGRRQALRACGKCLGLAFQITDDILNVVGDPRKLGKRTGSDAARSKATYPALFGLDRSRQMAGQELEAALVWLKPFGRRASPLKALARTLVERDR
jgi:geranylgeranyl diphosphate synthase type II